MFPIPKLSFEFALVLVFVLDLKGHYERSTPIFPSSSLPNETYLTYLASFHALP